MRFYTDVLGVVKKHDVPMGGEDRWLTIVSPEKPDGTELLLEPRGHPAAKPFKDALVADGIQFIRFAVDDVPAKYERLRRLGLRFTQQPTVMGPMTSCSRRYLRQPDPNRAQGQLADAWACRPGPR